MIFSFFVVKLRDCTPPTIFFSFAPVCSPYGIQHHILWDPERYLTIACVEFGLLSTLSYRDQDGLDEVLEKQAEMIRYLQQHNANLGKRIVDMAQQKKQREERVK